MRDNLLFSLLFVISIGFTFSAAFAQEPIPVFIRPAIEIEKELTLTMYGNFYYQEVTTIYSPIVGVIKNITVQTGDKVMKNKVLCTVYRDDPGFTKQEKKIKAPFTGIIGRIQAYTGTRISPQTPLMVISRYDPIYFTATTTEEYRDAIQPGVTLSISVAYLDTPVTGTVVNILPIDPAKKMLPINIRIDNPDNRISAGTEGKIQHSYAKQRVVVIPSEAVLVEKGRYFAWIAKDNRAYKKEIRTGQLMEQGIECLSGISAGDLVIYYGYLELEPGDPIEAVKTVDTEIANGR